MRRFSWLWRPFARRTVIFAVRRGFHFQIQMETGFPILVVGIVSTALSNLLFFHHQETSAQILSLLKHLAVTASTAVKEQSITEKKR